MKGFSALFISIMLFSMLLVAPLSHSAADTPPPEVGSWIIEDNDNTTMENETIVIHGNVIIQDGGVLTLKNCILKIDPKPLGFGGIEVEKGGKLYLYDSTVTSVYTAQLYKFSVNGKLIAERADISSVLTATFGLYLHNTNDTVIRDSRIHDNGPYCNGITVDDSSVLIENTVIYETYMGIQCGGLSNATILDNYIHSNNVGLSITGNATAFISGNDISDNINQGVLTDQQSKVYIINNTLRSNKKIGIGCYMHSSVDVVNNIISSNGLGGVACVDDSMVNISGNMISHTSGEHGVVIDEQSVVNMVDNVVSMNKKVGIACAGNSTTVIVNGTIANNGDHGIVVQNNARTIILNNTINSNSFSGIGCTHCSSTDISGNIISRNEYWGVHSQLSPNGKLIVENNYLYANGEAGIAVNFPSDVTLRSNTVSSSVKNGIEVLNGATPFTGNCTISDSGEYDLWIDDRSHPTIFNTNFDLNKLYFNDTESIISIGHWLNVNVCNKNDVPVQNAEITIANKDGTEVFNGTSDYNGHVSCIPVVEYDLDYTFNKTAYTPHNVYASKLGKSNSEKITIDRNRVVNFTLDISDKLSHGNLVTKVVEGHEATVEYLGNGTVTIESASMPAEMPNSTKDIGIFMEINTVGDVEDLYITIRYSEDELEGVNEANLRMYCYFGPGEYGPGEYGPGEYGPGEYGGWMLIKNSGVDIHSNTVWAKVNHTTIFAPMARETSKQTGSGTASIWFWYSSILAVLAILLLIFIPVMMKRKRKDVLE